ncbi:MAG: hypothetical protein JWQ49_5558 [Edaphobacter sp.]|nr:hypothetical protein [Edaphobacter sp.]
MRPEYRTKLFTLKADGYHYGEWQGTANAAAYTEWWCFSLYDKKNDLRGIVSYQVVDSKNLTGQGVSFVTAVAYKGDKIVNSLDLFSLSSFSSSLNDAEVRIGPDSITVFGPNTYQVSGASFNGRISWNLVYERAADSWFAADRVNVGPDPSELMDWLLHMPRARVSGTMIVDGKAIEVHSEGYHDHNWGEWNLSQVRWNWAQFSGPRLTFDLGDFIDNPNGRAAVDISGERIVFAASEYSIIHTKFAFDPVNKIEYPIQTVFRAPVSTGSWSRRGRSDDGRSKDGVTFRISRPGHLRTAFPLQRSYHDSRRGSPQRKRDQLRREWVQGVHRSLANSALDRITHATQFKIPIHMPISTLLTDDFNEA